jgi:hypothetical protein
MRHLVLAAAILVSAASPTRAATDPSPFSERAAVLLNVSEKDLNRVVIDSFHANGGPRFTGQKKRVSSSVADLSYRALFSDPVLKLGKDGTARLSLDIMDARLRIGRFEREIGGLPTQCEGAGFDVDPRHPVELELTFGLTVVNGALKVEPKSVEIPEADERLRLVEPARCKNALLPRWFLWSLGKPYLRHSLGSLDDEILKRARASAVRLEKKEGLLTTHWGLPWERGTDSVSKLKLVPETVDMSRGSLLVGLTASSAGAAPPAASTGRPLDPDGSLPPGSFLGLSETFMNEIARRAVTDRSASRRPSSGSFRKLRASDAAYALVPGLRGLASKDNVVFEIDFPTTPRFEFRPLDAPDATSGGSRALIRCLFSGVEINVRKNDDGKMTLLGTLHVDTGRMAVVPYTNQLGGISFRLVENQWKVSSTGLAFDEALAAATLQELAFGRIFATTYEPLLRRALHLGGTEFTPQSFAVNGSYLLIGLGETPRSGGEGPAVAAKRTGDPLGSR